MAGWNWLTDGFDLNSAIQALGLGTLAFLFARDIILTRGQHTRRTADLIANHNAQLVVINTAHSAEVTELKAHHAALIAVLTDRLHEMKDSRDYYREARMVDRDRADAVTDKLGVVVTEYAELTNHLLEALPRVGETK